jgi:putative inorganic carbon (HCO3(-)) transporter
MPWLTHLQLIALVFLVVQLAKTPLRMRSLGWAIILSLAVVAVCTLLSVLGVWEARNQEIEEEITFAGQTVRYGSFSGGVDWASIESMIGIIFGVHFLLGEKGTLKRALLLLCVAVMAAAELLTYSITGWVSLAVGLLVSLQRSGGTRVREMLKPIAVITLLAVVIVQFVPAVQVRLAVKIDQLKSQPYFHWFSSRLGTMEGGLRLLWDHPWLGVGAGNSKFYLPTYLPPDFGYDKLGAHNGYLEMGNDLGIPAMILFSILLLAPTLGLRRFVSKVGRAQGLLTDAENIVLRAVFGSLVALAIASFGQGTERMKYLWLLVGMAISLQRYFKRIYPAGSAPALGSRKVRGGGVEFPC